MLNGTEILTCAQMRAIESEAIASGEVTGLELMERAGRAVAGEIRLRWPKPGRVTVLCGPGNNGGDGYVIARRLHQAGWQVRVLGTDNTPGPDAAEMKRRWCEIGGIGPLTQRVLRSGPDDDVFVDAIFGTGLTRPVVLGEIAGLLNYLGGHGGDDYRSYLVAVDCPSGMCLDSGLFLGRPRDYDFEPRAGLTVTFDSPKFGHLLAGGPQACGKLVIADIGLRRWREIFAIKSPKVAKRTRHIRRPGNIALWPKFHVPDSRTMMMLSPEELSLKTSEKHKYDYDHASIIAGDPASGGAAQLSAIAALRVGAGLVTICPAAKAMSEHMDPPYALMRRSVDDAKDLAQMLSDKRVRGICIGPGCGVDRAAELLPSILASRKSVVIDADAITAISKNFKLGDALHEDCILTPHTGEFARLFPDLAEKIEATPVQGPAYSKLDAVRDAVVRCGAVILLKGPDTVIAAPDGRACIHSAFDVPWLATAGSGDVLAGIITGLLARGFQPLDAASLGALIHAKAARLFGPGLIADDLPDMIPQVFREIGV